ncbi:hypothetical protein SASPL_144456 [Salvia splendens]|uniref:Gamma-soluble NSF attachment protein n=1 Tax=Salvia splendens TaxID=180675 RepID=A0A8X8Z6H1_SALSN|nr:hypothetical protein SASPL_144456 [Salvia splendens]
MSNLKNRRFLVEIFTNLQDKLSLTRWNADWRNATALYEQAGNAYRLARKFEQAKEAFEKASKGHEMLASPWDAAKHMETAGALAKDVGNWNEVSDFYRRASELYIECGRVQPASDALAKWARFMKFVSKFRARCVALSFKKDGGEPPTDVAGDAGGVVCSCCSSLICSSILDLQMELIAFSVRGVPDEDEWLAFVIEFTPR